jgi:hypothetical protein
MTIIVMLFDLNEDKTNIKVPGTVIAKVKEEKLGFDYTNPNNWIIFVRKHFSQILKQYGNSVRWSIYRLGGNPSYINYFPGYNRQAKQISIFERGKI